KFGLLGISIDRAVAEMLPGLREHYGVVVAAKAAYVPSQEVPVEPGDVIHAINQTRIATLETLRAAVEALKPGDPVVLEIERPGRTLFVAFEME
ncbi:MAG: PDZ domain-containing protein, partial [Candidatus Solibacter usitatus]|nr:PDZ domain-containing protein [Candidatus Solibacter usitatus]